MDLTYQEKVDMVNELIQHMIFINASINFLKDNELLTQKADELSALLVATIYKDFKQRGLNWNDLEKIWIEEFGGMNLLGNESEKEVFGSIAYFFYQMVLLDKKYPDYLKKALEDYEKQFDINEFIGLDEIDKVTKIATELMTLANKYL